MPTVDFTEEERSALSRFLRGAIEADRYPLSLRLRPIRSALEKLDPSPQPEPLPPLKPAGQPSLVVARMRDARRRR